MRRLIWINTAYKWHKVGFPGAALRTKDGNWFRFQTTTDSWNNQVEQLTLIKYFSSFEHHLGNVSMDVDVFKVNLFYIYQLH